MGHPICGRSFAVMLSGDYRFVGHFGGRITRYCHCKILHNKMCYSKALLCRAGLKGGRGHLPRGGTFLRAFWGGKFSKAVIFQCLCWLSVRCENRAIVSGGWSWATSIICPGAENLLIRPCLEKLLTLLRKTKVITASRKPTGHRGWRTVGAEHIWL